MSLDKVLAWAIGGLALAAILAIGGVHPTTQVVLSLAALLLVGVCAFAARRPLTPVPLMWPALIAVGYTALQMVPLPSGLVAALSPMAHELRSETGTGGLMPISLDVPATALALARGFACFGLLMATAALGRSHRSARVMLHALTIAGVVLAVITMVQRIVGAQAILFFYHPESLPGGGFFGTFVSGNHAASVFALSTLVAGGLAMEAKEGRRFALVAAAALTGSMVFFTASRAGTLGLAVGAMILLSAFLTRRLGRASGILTALALMAVASGAALWMADGLRSRLMPAASDALYENQKLRGWKDAAQLTAAYRWTGVGRGAFEAPVEAFRQDDEQVRLAYPENMLLQASSEWGVPITLLLIGLVGGALLGLAAALRDRELGIIGAAAGVAAVLVHEMADFGLEVLGVAIPTVIAAGVVIGRIERKRPPEGAAQPLDKRVVGAALVAWGAALLPAIWAVPHTLDSDFARVAAAYKERSPDLDARWRAATAIHPANDHLELVAAEDALRRKDPKALHHLNRALRLHPANGQAHYLAARTLLGLGRRAQAALEFRMAMERGLETSVDELLATLGTHVVDAYPQRTEDLMRLGHELARRHKAAEADAACQRAVQLATLAAPARAERVEVAIQANDPRTLTAAAQALLDGQPDAEAAALGLRALAQTGNVKATEAALEQAVKLHPDSSLLVLTGAQLRFDRGDLPGARLLLKHTGDGSYSLADRLRAEELLAKIADREGDVDGAVLARARARLIAHKLDDTSAMP
jgi:Tfp pilus assembly protein PilF